MSSLSRYAGVQGRTLTHAGNGEETRCRLRAVRRDEGDAIVARDAGRAKLAADRRHQVVQFTIGETRPAWCENRRSEVVFNSKGKHYSIIILSQMRQDARFFFLVNRDQAAARYCTARRSAARARRRVESSVGNDALASLMMSGISVQPRITASHPASFRRSITP